MNQNGDIAKGGLHIKPLTIFGYHRADLIKIKSTLPTDYILIYFYSFLYLHKNQEEDSSQQYFTVHGNSL